MTQAVVVDQPAPAGLHPVRVKPLQFIRIPHALRRTEMDAGVANLYSAVAGRKVSGMGEVDRLALGGHLDKLDQGRCNLSLAERRIIDSQAAAGGKPEPSIFCPGSTPSRGITRRTLGATQSVLHAVIDG